MTATREERFRRAGAPHGDFLSPGAPCASLLGQDFMRVLRAVRGSTVAPDRCWVAGGALRDWVAGAERRDVDVFFSAPVFAMAAADRLLRDVDGLDARLAERTEWVTRFDTAVGRVELVTGAYYPTALALVRSFDFAACAAAVDAGGRLTHHVDFEDDAPSRLLRVSALPAPVASYWRWCRLRDRGWGMDGDDRRLLLREAVERGRGEDWSHRAYDGCAAPKGMPRWARVAWAALRGTPDQYALPAVMRRAAADEAWACALEGFALLAGFDEGGLPPTGKLGDPARAVRAGVRDFIARGVEEERASWA